MVMAQSSRSNYSSDSGGSPGGSPGHRTYMCKVCGNIFNSGQSLGGHMNVHRKQDPRSSSPQSSTPPHISGESNSPGADNSQQSVGYKGVRYRKEQNKWVAEIRPPRATKTWWLGTYSTPEEAAYAYDVAITYFQSESSLNFNGHPIYDQIPTISTDLERQDFAAELRRVVKKYGKLAMESGTMNTAPAASTSTAGETREVWGWEDFNTAPPEISSSNWTEHMPFDFEETYPMTAPESSYQFLDFDQANSYYDYGGYQQEYNWPSYHGQDGYNCP